MSRKKKTKGAKKLPPKPQIPLQGAPAPVTPDRARALLAEHTRAGPKGKSQLIPPQEAVDNNSFLRFSAGLYYATSFEGTTLAQMAKHPVFGKVSVDTLANWSTQDRWVERRRHNMDTWRRAIENKIGSELVKMRTDQLEKMREVFDKMMARLVGGRLKAKSYEGMVTAMVRLAQLMDDWNEKLFRAVIPDLPAASISATAPAMAATKPRLSVPEARKAASAILAMRRNEMRAEAARARAEKEGKSVSLQVVQGETDGNATDGAAEAPEAGQEGSGGGGTGDFVSSTKP